MPESRKFAVAASFASLCVIWSSTWLAIKWGLQDLPPISFAAIRFAIAIVALLAVSIGRVPLWPRNRIDWAILALTGVIMFAINYGLLFWGELHVSSGLAAVLQAIIPVAGLVFAHWMLPSEPMRWQRLVGALLAIAGVAMICGRLFDHGGVMAFWGGLGIVIGGVGAAFSNVLLKRRALELAPAMIAAWQMIFGTVPLLGVGLLHDGNPLRFHWSGLAIACLLYLAIIGSALAFLLLYWLLPRMPVNNLQTISLITPPGAVAIGWFFGGETFTLWSLVGGALVLAGVWLIFRRLDPPRQPEGTRECLKTALPRG